MSKEKPTSDIPVSVKFGLLCGLQGLSRHEDAPRPVLFGELLHYVHGNPQVNRQAIERALQDDVSLRAQFDELLAQHRRFFAPRLVAANSGEKTSERIGEGFRLKIRPSRAGGEQSYIILELDSPSVVSDGDALSLHVRQGSRWASVAFPDLHDQKSQVIVQADDLLLQLLTHSDAEVSII